MRLNSEIGPRYWRTKNPLKNRHLDVGPTESCFLQLIYQHLEKVAEQWFQYCQQKKDISKTPKVPKQSQMKIDTQNPCHSSDVVVTLAATIQ